MTPRVLNVYAKAYEEEKQLKQKENIYQAYLISRWVWQKRVDIEKVVKSIDSKKSNKKQMTDEQMLAQAKALNALFGGEVKINGSK
jgi:hypothetical protein